MVRKQTKNYTPASVDNILKGFVYPPEDYIDAPTVYDVPTPTPPAKPVVVTVKCAWRHQDCRGIVVDGRDLCQAHLAEVKARSRTLKAKRAAS